MWSVSESFLRNLRNRARNRAEKTEKHRVTVIFAERDMRRDRVEPTASQLEELDLVQLRLRMIDGGRN
jgi:hypothetical protein